MSLKKSILLAALAGSTLFGAVNPTVVFAQEEVAEQDVTKISEITVLDTISETDLEQKINQAFADTGAEVVITNYVPDPNSIMPLDQYVENKKSYSFLSYAYTIDIVVYGYLVGGGYTLSGFNCSTAVSNSIIVVNSITKYNVTTPSAARASVVFTLNGQVPHTYRVEAYLQQAFQIYG